MDDAPSVPSGDEAQSRPSVPREDRDAEGQLLVSGDDADRPATAGLHHVSAVAGDPQENLDFYVDALGLSLVKKTVNFEDKFAYHLYYGDESGSIGSLLTFFPYRGGQAGRIGRPQPSATAFAVPRGAAGYWYHRLDGRGVDVDSPVERFGDRVVAFDDHDGLRIELVESDVDGGTDAVGSTGVDRAVDGSAPTEYAVDGPVPEDHAIDGLHSVTLLSASVYHTAATLEVLGFDLAGQEGDRVRYRAPGDRGAVVDLLDVSAEYGREGIGTVHHVAFRATGASIEAWRDRLRAAGLEPTRIKDRRYFRSIYFREPGGILFELATDEPGLTVDEPADALGRELRLPDQFEPDREMIAEHLPALAGPAEADRPQDARDEDR